MHIGQQEKNSQYFRPRLLTALLETAVVLPPASSRLTIICSILWPTYSTLSPHV